MAGNEKKAPWGLVIVVIVLVGGGLLAYWIYNKIRQGGSILGNVVGGIAGGSAGAFVGVSNAITNAAGGAGAVIVSPITDLQNVTATQKANAEASNAAVQAVVANSGAQNAAVTKAENNAITSGASQYSILMVDVNAYDPIIAPFMTQTAYNGMISDGVPASQINVRLNVIELDANGANPTTVVSGKVSALAVKNLLIGYGVDAGQATSMGNRLAGQ